MSPLANDAGILRIYVSENDQYRPLGRFDRGDMIFRQPSLGERIGSFVRGRGW